MNSIFFLGGQFAPDGGGQFESDCIGQPNHLRGGQFDRCLQPNTRSVSNKGNAKIPNPIAGDPKTGKILEDSAVSINRITKIAFTNPSSIDPVSPINILAGEKL